MNPARQVKGRGGQPAAEAEILGLIGLNLGLLVILSPFIL